MIWSALALVGMAIPALLLTAYATLGVVQIVRGAINPNMLVVFAVIAAGVVWLTLVNGWRAGRAGVTAEDLRALRRGAQSGGLLAADRTDVLDASVALDERAEPAAEVLPALEALVAEVAGAVGVAPPAHVLVTRAQTELAASPAVLSVPLPLLAVASIDELRAELARVLRSAATSNLPAMQLAATVETMAHGVTSAESVWLSRALAIGRPAANRAASAARALAAAETADAVGLADRSTAPGMAALARARVIATCALWPQHVAAVQRAWSDTSAQVAPLEGWPATYAAAVGTRVARRLEPFATPADRLGLTPVDQVPAEVPPLPTVSALDVLAGAQAPHVVRALDDAAAASYAQPAAVEAFGEPLEGAPPLVTLDELAGAAAGSPQPVLASVAGELGLLEQAMFRRDACALDRARALDHAGAAPAVRVNAAAARWLCGDPAGLDAIRAAVRTHPRAIGAIAPLEGSLRAAGVFDLADELGALRARADRVISQRVNVTAMFGRGAQLMPATLDARARQAVAEHVGGLKGVRRAWVMVATDDADPLFAPYLLVLKFRNQLSADVPTDPELLAAVLPIVRIVAWHEMDTRRRTWLRRRIPPVWDASAGGRGRGAAGELQPT